MKRFFIILIIILIAGVAGLSYYVNKNSDRSFDEQYPVPEITVEADSTKIAHGKYLALGPAHCAHCHTALENIPALERGEEVQMSGGFLFELPVGKLYTPNITSDVETGIGGYTDGHLYRMLRHNIRHDGQACFELMPFFNMTEYDIESIIAYLRTLEPVKNRTPENEWNPMGQIVRTFVLKPNEPNGPPRDHIERDTTVAYGKYLSEAVANCYGCHTNRNLKTGEFIGEPYAGGLVFQDASTQHWRFVTPNITTDPETGVIAGWTENQFVQRMRGGRTHQTSPMPWGPFSRLDELDLRAIYRFLQTVEPVNQDNGEIVTPPDSEPS